MVFRCSDGTSIYPFHSCVVHFCGHFSLPCDFYIRFVALLPLGHGLDCVGPLVHLIQIHHSVYIRLVIGSGTEQCAVFFFFLVD